MQTKADDVADKSDIQPWNFPLRYEGELYQVKEPSIAQLEFLLGIAGKPPDEVYKIMWKLFCELTPIRDYFEFDDLACFFIAMVGYILRRDDDSQAAIDKLEDAQLR